VSSQLGELHLLTVQLGEERRHGAMELRHLYPPGAVPPRRRSDPRDPAQGALVHRRPPADGELHHVLGVEGRNQLSGRAERDHPAMVHDRDAVAEALRLFHIVSGEQNGPAVRLEALDQLPELAAGLRVEPGGGLVEEEQGRVAH
jgi:hypothetical protein